jgi:hypothetical protein
MVKVGGEVDAVCGRCELTLAHTVIALFPDGRPARVACNTCHAEHRFRAPAGGAATASVTARKAARPARERKVEVPFAEVLASKRRPPVPYSARRTFAVDDVVDHPAFGRGFVTSVRADKIEIAFLGDVKVLVHARS